MRVLLPPTKHPLIPPNRQRCTEGDGAQLATGAAEDGYAVEEDETGQQSGGDHRQGRGKSLWCSHAGEGSTDHHYGQQRPVLGEDGGQQQSTDEAACYQWAVQNTGSDPFELQKQSAQQQQQAAQTEQQIAAARARVLENTQQVGVHMIDAIHAWWRHLDEPRDTIADDPGPLLPGPWDAA